MPPSAFSPSRLLRANLDALAFSPSKPLWLFENLLLVTAHALGLAACWYLLHIAWGWYALALGIVVALQFTPIQRRVNFSVAALAPFFFVYALVAIRFIYIRIWHGAVSGYFDYALPDWRLPFLQLQVATLAALVYTALCVAAALLKSRRRLALATSAVLVGIALGWASVEYSGQRTRGATGSDPYAYVQMGVDLATRATPAHHFALFSESAPLNIAWYPILHVGYRLPFNPLGDAVTVWPVGGAVAYALAYRVVGEEGLYWVNPLFSLFAVMMVGLLTWELARAAATAVRALIAAGTAALVATANEQVTWAVVPMVDAQAEFFSALALYLALRGRRAEGFVMPFLSGLALGAAYDVRHTQVALALALALVLWSSAPNVRAKIRALVACGAGALLVAFPDLWYHQVYLGGWLTPESEELALYAWSALGETASRLFQQACAGYEFGWLAPFALYGSVALARRARVEFLALAAWLGLTLAVQLPYAALRLRDLLPEFPTLAFAASYGIFTLAAQLLGKRAWQVRLIAGLVIFAVVQLATLRVWYTVSRPLRPVTPPFGYVTTAQRAAFDRIAALTPADAAIGSTLNDGAIELYAQRATFRPDAWSGSELRAFLKAMRRRQARVFLLEDGGAMDGVLTDLRRDHRVTRVAVLDVPLFGETLIEQAGALWEIGE